MFTRLLDGPALGIISGIPLIAGKRLRTEELALIVVHLEEVGVKHPSLFPGKRFAGAYVLMRQIGTGEGGQRWLAHDEALGRDVALQFIPEVASLPELLEVVRTDVLRARRLIHPNITRVYDLVSDEGTGAIVREYVEGSSLSLLLKEKASQCFEPGEIRDWLGQLCRTLSDLHRIELAHGALSLNNLLVDTEGRLLLDGVSTDRVFEHTFSSAGETQSPDADYDYRSPAKADRRTATAADDIFALGACIYELLTGESPFRGKTVALRAVETSTAALVERRLEMTRGNGLIPAAWGQTVVACLALDEKKRPAADQVSAMLGLWNKAAAPRDVSRGSTAEVSETVRVDELRGASAPVEPSAPAKIHRKLATPAAPHRIQRQQSESPQRSVHNGRITSDQRSFPHKAETNAGASAIQMPAAEVLRRPTQRRTKLPLVSIGMVAAIGVVLAVSFHRRFEIGRRAGDYVSGGIEKGIAAFRGNPVKHEALHRNASGQQGGAAAVSISSVDGNEAHIDNGPPTASAEADAEVSASTPSVGNSLPPDSDVPADVLPQSDLPIVAGPTENQPIVPIERTSTLSRVDSSGVSESMVASGAVPAESRTPDNELSQELQPATDLFENSLGMKFARLESDLLVGIWPVRVKDFESFASETKFDDTSWKTPGFQQGPDHPVVNVTWNQAVAFCEWLTKRERKLGLITSNQVYRLPTDQEWSRAVELVSEEGATPEARDMAVPDVFPWGTQWPPPIGAGNYSGQETGADAAIEGYEDSFAWTSPVGSFRPNKLGLYDMGGNVWQWCADNWNMQANAKVLRGGSWSDGAPKLGLLSSCRIPSDPGSTKDHYGFRVVRAADSTPAKKR